MVFVWALNKADAWDWLKPECKTPEGGWSMLEQCDDVLDMLGIPDSPVSASPYRSTRNAVKIASCHFLGEG